MRRPMASGGAVSMDLLLKEPAKPAENGLA
jgi:hypothetical protein